MQQSRLRRIKGKQGKSLCVCSALSADGPELGSFWTVILGLTPRCSNPGSSAKAGTWPDGLTLELALCIGLGPVFDHLDCLPI